MEKIIEKLLIDIRSLYKQAEDRRIQGEQRGDFFNVFNTIGLRTEEVRLHSAMIAELLNPNGSHGLSKQFLQTFLERLGLPNDYIKEVKGKITERDIGRKTKTHGGRIDIIIEDGNHAIIIENKIYAEDQENQLLRYYNYGKENFKDGFKLFYLTLEGNGAEKKSLGGKEVTYKNLSYKENIIEWLDECTEIANENPLAKAVIIQYRELIKQLTNTDMDKQYEEELLDLMVKPDNAIAMSEMLAIKDEWFSRIMDNYIWNPLKEYASSKNMKMEKEVNPGYETGALIYKKEWEHCGLFVWTDSKRYWSDMYISISYNGAPGRNRIKKDKRIKLDCFEEEPDLENPYGRVYLPIDMRNWDSSITDKIVSKEVVNYIIDKFNQILEEIEKKNILMF
jgi:hypothetical protein